MKRGPPGREVPLLLLDPKLSQTLTALLDQLAEDLLARLYGLALALDRRLLEVLPLPQLGQDSRLLDLALEPAERVLEALLLTHMHDGHLVLTSLLPWSSRGAPIG